MANFTIQNGRRMADFQDKQTKNNRLPNLPNMYILSTFDENQSKNEVCRAVTRIRDERTGKRERV